MALALKISRKFVTRKRFYSLSSSALYPTQALQASLRSSKRGERE